MTGESGPTTNTSSRRRHNASQVWSCDFLTVVTVHFQTLYAFVVVSLERRGIVHVGRAAHD
jgi:hypothetical protein